jgi:tryptophan synthase alpha chain
LQYGVEAFCKKCQEIGVDGLILPDLPLAVYEDEYKAIFDKYDLKFIFLITPQTSDDRIQQIDAASDAFIYMVSSASVTGSKSGFGDEQTDYFKRISDLSLSNPQIIGFGINNNETFKQAIKFAKGAIIGSAFIKNLTENGVSSISKFINEIK